MGLTCRSCLAFLLLIPAVACDSGAEDGSTDASGVESGGGSTGTDVPPEHAAAHCSQLSSQDECLDAIPPGDYGCSWAEVRLYSSAESCDFEASFRCVALDGFEPSAPHCQSTPGCENPSESPNVFIAPAFRALGDGVVEVADTCSHRIPVGADPAWAICEADDLAQPGPCRCSCDEV